MLDTWGSPCRMLPRNCQMLLFSATFEDSVWKFAQKVVPDPNIIKLKREEETLDTIKQYYVLCNSRDEKFQALCNIYGAITIAQAMIFCHVSSSSSSSRPAGLGGPWRMWPRPSHSDSSTYCRGLLTACGWKGNKISPRT